MITFARIAAWFATSQIGRAIVAGVAVAGTVLIAALKIFSAGKAAERASQDQQSLENLRNRNETDDEVRNLRDDDLNKRLSRWVRPPDQHW
ncbi:hypothetical protein X566_15420 [Afipia sp. P52-10]|uniref:hypothetical protein n=1 Tax=Afipia sp. P52-10 TaxID=1429916 RepID=UPI0003DF0E90|nr:hypothetical protein [Afipia sp. P52-10]ETR79164.1 hypothetical protein X566_15420 [Afipia sp. P52-10]